MDERLKEALDKIKAEEELKSSTRGFLEKKTHGYRNSRNFSYKWLVTVMACLALLLFGTGGYYVYFTPVSAISVDVNPSFELGINRFDRVVSVKGYNKDGRALTDSLDIKFLYYTDALDRILADDSIKGYLSGNGVMSITVVGADKVKNDELLTGVESCTASHKNVYCHEGNSEYTAAAHAAGLSFGKYRAFLELQELDPDITPEDVRGLTMKQIRDLIEELSGSRDTSQDNKNAESVSPGDSHQGQAHDHGCGAVNPTGSKGGTGNGPGDGSGNGTEDGSRKGAGNGHWHK